MTREAVAAPTGAMPLKRAAKQTKVTHPDRVIDPASKATKLDLVRYYESMADWLLPHLKGRPCSLVRGPEGVTGELFFQKHLGKVKLAGVKTLDPALWPEHEPLLEVATAQGIASAAQMNVIEFHTWNAMARTIDKPDRMVFDLDPATAWRGRACKRPRRWCIRFSRSSACRPGLKTSGGKGCVGSAAGSAPRLDTVKGFSQAVVEHLASVVPNRFSAKSGAQTASARCSSTTSATRTAPPLAAAYSCARGGWGWCRCRCRGIS